MGKDGRYWLIFATLLLIMAIDNFVEDMRKDLIIMPFYFSIIFTLYYLKEIEKKVYIKKEHHKKLTIIILIIYIMFTILFMIGTMMTFVWGLGMSVIVASLAGIIYCAISFVRLIRFYQRTD